MRRTGIEIAGLLCCLIVVFDCGKEKQGNDRATPCTSAVSEARQGPGNAAATVAATSEDCAVLETVLSDLATFEDFLGSSHAGAVGVMVQDNETIGNSVYIGYQLDGELKQKSLSVPADAMSDLRRRNTVTSSLNACAFEDSIVVLRDLKTVFEKSEDADEAFKREYPSARGYASAWLPGYSDDRTMAVVRLAVGPAFHGATASYLLRKDGKNWKVEWRFVSYYV